MPGLRNKRKKKKDPKEEARLAEEAKRKEQERLAEEARLAALAKAKAEADAIIKAKLATPEGRANDLKQWLDTIPLSKKNITRVDREFSDGVLVAEIIANYCPDICNKKQYFTWYSSSNKHCNWEALNRKVFPELGFSLSYAQICNLIKPWGSGGTFCQNTLSGEPYIYTLLDRIKEGIEKLNPSIYDYRQPDFKPTKLPEEEEAPKKIKRTPRVDLDVKPPYSKIEIQIANGLFDDDDKKNQDDDKCCKINTCYSTHDNLYDWVEVSGCGGEIKYDEMQACPGKVKRCWTCI